MKTRFVAVLALAVAALALAVPAGAIVFGQLDTTNRYPYVGAVLADYDDENPGVEVLCSGTLIASDVFLTAGHCTAFLASIDVTDVWVTFDPSFDAASPLIHGEYTTHPLFASGGQSNTFDLAVIELDRVATGITPARLPTLNYLNTISLRSQRFTAVGYGTVREDKTKGPHTLFFDSMRRYADQGFRSLTKSWLNLSMNPSVGSGGTCFGDSGGPHFVGATNLVVSVTVTGDRFCRATDVTYRVDTPSARTFLDDFVTLP
jgi:secreted trypsin-like serine protease